MSEIRIRRPGMKLAKIGGLIIGITVVLAVLLPLIGPGEWSAGLVLAMLLLGVGVGIVIVVIGFVKRHFAAVENH